MIALSTSVLFGTAAGAEEEGIDYASLSFEDFPHAPAALEEPPLPDDLGSFVKDMDAAILLGKALFWDIQVGSDGLTSCATCHYQAGASVRIKNTLHPGPDDFDPTATGAIGANIELTAGDFPFTRFLDPNEQNSSSLEPIFDTNDVAGATGVIDKDFDGLSGTSVDDGTLTAGSEPFNVGGVNVRQVTGRQAPTVIGSIHHMRLFWDGRASYFFNGRNPHGDRDPSATVFCVDEFGDIVETSILLNNAAGASQAVGPPLSDVEMSWAGRDFVTLGKKMIPATPLADQLVDPTDSVLGALSASPADGLVGVTYGDLIEAAFHEKWWDHVDEPIPGCSMMEANFSLFWGLAILCYEATLNPDGTPYDDFARGDAQALTAQEKHGLDIFLNEGGCASCHEGGMFAGALTVDFFGESASEEFIEFMPMANSGAHNEIELSSLAVDPRNTMIRLLPPLSSGFNQPVAQGFLVAPSGPCNGASHEATLVLTKNPVISAEVEAEVSISVDDDCERLLSLSAGWVSSENPDALNNTLPDGEYRLYSGFTLLGTISLYEEAPNAFYDSGFYNIGVRPTEEDLGVGADGFGGIPLSHTRRKQDDNFPPPFSTHCPMPGDRVAVDGAFKTPTVRNVELTGPYFHNGGKATLEELVNFYARGTDFGPENRDDLDPDVGGFDISLEERAALVAFMKALTDPRVKDESAPFDHPELPLPSGHTGDHTSVVVGSEPGVAEDEIEIIPATGAAGRAAAAIPMIETFIEKLAPGATLYPLGGLEDFEGEEEEEEIAGLLEGPLASNEFIAILDKAPLPGMSVLIDMVVSDPSQATVSPTALLFTAENWDQPQVVQVLGTPDAVEEPAGTPVSIMSTTTSSDPAFDGLALEMVEAIIFDMPPPVPEALTPSLEAEAGELSAPIEMRSFGFASGGAFVWAPPAAGDVTDPVGAPGGIVSYEIEVTEEQSLFGPFVLWARQYAPNGADRFWVSIDGLPWMEWNMFVGPNRTWVWDRINDAGAAIELPLAAGVHTIEIMHGDAGAFLDVLTISNDPAFVPAGDPVDPMDGVIEVR